MTGVGTVELDNGQRISVVARPEIILEGTKDGGQTWKAYHFKYKPGDVMSAPRVVAPFHPRLDWQMWFAGLGDYQSSPWLVHFVAKLLEGSPDVKELLDVTRDPFADAPPDAIRAQLYYYDFTRLNTSWNQATPTAKILDNSSDPQWWTRTFAREYLPALERGNPSLAAFVQHHWHEPSAVSKLSPEASALRQWTDRALTWLCRAPWSPVGLALGFVRVISAEESERRETRMETTADQRKCHNCGQAGHIRRDCPEAPSQEGGFSGGFNSGAACFGCGKTGHLKRDCPTGGRACHNCGQVGHIRRDCPEDVQPPKCHNCGESGHLRRDCPQELRESRKCHHCGQSGHLRRDCPDDSGPSEDKCYQCGETGHWARNCPGAKE
ncbi:hypothetical protein KRP22_003185 [Phytophthora ramorum]|nr:Lipase maturation factor 2 [Phytophthora ramorum]KAH7503788.1 Lipase maturation factor 2 [Phytophthora ramorum]